MKERPILFSAPMVRALLDGSKTQTRRIANTGLYAIDARFHGAETAARELGALTKKCPYGAPGDHLLVRETFFAYGRWETRYSAKKGRDEWHFVDMTLECGRAYQHAASAPDVPLATGRGAMPGWWKRPAIFMPRVACRIPLEIVAVRVERLNHCGEADARAEGVTIEDHHMNGYCAGEFLPPSIRAYRDLWEQINGAGSWAANPWVWVIEFKRITPALATTPMNPSAGMRCPVCCAKAGEPHLQTCPENSIEGYKNGK